MSQKIPVPEGTVVRRINRVLVKQSLRLHKTRLRGLSPGNLGRYYILDTRTNTLVNSHIALEMYANDLGVLSGYCQPNKN
jgi:hypothetical protein